MRPKALVLGAGIQGCCVALALAHAGWRVRLIEQHDSPWQATSRVGEGKLHLGYVYANESSRNTASLMLQGALQFSDLLDRWVPQEIPWESLRSTPFIYAVLAETMVSTADLEAHYAWVDSCLSEQFSAGATYAGLQQDRRGTVEVDPARTGFSEAIVSAFQTQEVALNPRSLRKHVVEGLPLLDIEFVGSTRVEELERRPQGLLVLTRSCDGEYHQEQSDIVVNCLWHDRLRIDATLGIKPARPWSYRLKHGIRGKRPTAQDSQQPPSTTFALGPFGDYVAYANSTFYLSWYRECMTDWDNGLSPPSDWDHRISGRQPWSREEEIGLRSLDAIADLLPATRGLKPESVEPGIIVAWGKTDIHDPESELHSRSDIGIQVYDDYFSIDTGKFTTAPLFASMLLKHL